ncbi:hypothetical protein PR048_033021, partial [Dryococelus australis]
MSYKWKIFHRPMNVGISLAEDIIKTFCILHNYVRNVDTDSESRGTSAAIRIRDKFSDFFVSEEGALHGKF